MSGAPDPKPGHRIVLRDPAAVRLATLCQRECVACGQPAANGHHFLERDDGGDDVNVNVISLCGSGSMGCHGARHGAPYVDPRGRRWTSADVGAAIGLWVVENQPAAIDYVIRKLGPVAGRFYLAERYSIQVPDTVPADIVRPPDE